tara:strand:- start:2278 stop:2601 length:324 start_codon:yes stop_codon:yes gene_type:complete
MNIIKVTKNAHKILSQINKNYNKEFISFGIKSGGCSGFQYVINPCNDKPNKLDEIIDMKDYKIKIENEFIFKLIGTEIDYTNDIMGQRFVFNNPNSDFECGCGKSFS